MSVLAEDAIALVKNQVDIGLVTARPDEAIHLYGNILGLKQGKSIPLGNDVIQHRFFFGRNLIKINHVAHVEQQFAGGMHNAIGIRLLALIVEQLEPILSRLDAAGIKHSKTENFNDVRLLFFKDNDGNLIELIEAPALAMADDRVQIGLCVSDSDASRHFYGKVLGFREETPMDMGNGKILHGFRGGDSLLKCWQAEKDVPIFSGMHFDKIGLRYITFIVRDMDACFDYLQKQQVVIMREPIDIDGVAKVLLVADPDNNCIEFVEYY